MQRVDFRQQYRDFVSELIATSPLDVAMARAVGAGNDTAKEHQNTGEAEAELLSRVGLRCGHSLIDMGCGSGRLSTALGQRLGTSIEYLGVDIIPELIDYARAKAPPSYRFVIHDEMSVPALDQTADFIVAFSLFTHLLHEETYVYLRDARRALKPDGRIVFSFIELPTHWFVFEAMASIPGQNFTILIARSMIETWAEKLDLRIECYDPYPFGQSVVVLRH